MAENKLKQKLKNGEVALGPFVNLASGALIEIAAYAGFDFVILDTEHGPLDIPSVEDLCRTARGADITPVVRVRENDPPQILHPWVSVHPGPDSTRLCVSISSVPVPPLRCGLPVHLLP